MASGPRLKLASCKSALTLPLVVYSTARYKEVVPVLVLCFVVFGLFYEAICFMSYLVLFCSCVFLSFQHCDYLAWGRERSNLSVFRTLVRFALVWFCLLTLPLGVWEGLRFVIVALPGLFSYLLCDCGTPWSFLLFFLCIQISYSSRNQNGFSTKCIHYITFFFGCALRLSHCLCIFTDICIHCYHKVKTYTMLSLSKDKLVRFWFSKN